MKITKAHVVGVLKGEYAFGASADVGRVFMRCHGCRRLVPYWHCVATKAQRSRGDGRGCKCGSPYVKTATISELRAAWWVLVRGWLWRGLIRRRENWDPRMPTR